LDCDCVQLVGSPVNCTVRRAAGNDTTAEVGGTQQRTPAQEEASVLNAIMASNPNLRATQVQKATWARRAHIAPQIHSTRVACACFTGNRVLPRLTCRRSLAWQRQGHNSTATSYYGDRKFVQYDHEKGGAQVRVREEMRERRGWARRDSIGLAVDS